MRRADKPIRYENHALRRMKQRNVTYDQVTRTVRAPQENRPAKRPGARRLRRRFSASKVLNVIVEERPRSEVRSQRSEVGCALLIFPGSRFLIPDS